MLTTLFGFSAIFFNCLFGQVRQNEPLKKTSSLLITNIVDHAFYEKTKTQIPLTGYETTTIVNVSMGNCVSAVKDVVKDLEFLNSEEHKRRIYLANNQWTVDYEFEALWPASKSFEKNKKCLREDTFNTITTLSITIFLSKMRDNSRKRLTYCNVMHVFNDLGSNRVKVTTTVKISPLIQPPNWQVNYFFLDGKANVLNRLAKQTNCYY